MKPGTLTVFVVLLLEGTNYGNFRFRANLVIDDFIPTIVLALISFFPLIAVGARRLHDIDKSGWFVLISFIPFIGWIIMIAMLAGKGTEGKNRFGDYPLELKKQKSKL